MSFVDHNYEPIMNLLKINSLQHSRAINDLKFLFKVFSQELNCLELSNKVKIFESQNPYRKPKLLFLEKCSKLPYSVINRICYLANINKKWIRFKNISRYQLDKSLKSNTITLSLNN